MNRIVVITGASSGIGLSCVDFYKNNNDTVINISTSACDKTEHNYICDVSNEENVKLVFDMIAQKFSTIDVLINCAGYGLSGATELVPILDAKKLFDVNVFGVMICSNNALPLMKQGSKIINISSSMALFPLPFRSYYSASKAAVLNLSYGQRLELANAKICVSAVCPGNIKTNFTKNRAKSFVTNNRYGDLIKTSTDNLDNKEDKRIDPLVVGKAIFKLSNKKHPKAMIIVGFKDRFLNFAKHIFPMSWILWGCSKFGIKKTK